MSEFSNPGWMAKFGNALAGITKGAKGQNSFLVHGPFAIAVIAIASWLRMDVPRFSILILCIAVVLACELLNSAFERIAKSVTQDFDENVKDALDIASGAVLLVSIHAAIVGCLILLPPVFSYWK